MNSKRKILIYVLIIILLDLTLFLTPLNNRLILSLNYLIISIYLIFNVFSRIKEKKLLIIYFIYFLTLLLFNIFSFSTINLFLSIIILILGIYQIKTTKKRSSVIIIEKPKTEKKDVTINVELPSNFDIEEFEHIAQKLYSDMQTYFMNLEYEKLECILDQDLYKQFSSQMKVLEKNNKRAIRENFKFIDFKINDFKEIDDNKLIVSTSLGVIEDKYTKTIDFETNNTNHSYESYYEIVYIKQQEWVISSLKLIYSHSNRKKS